MNSLLPLSDWYFSISIITQRLNVDQINRINSNIITEDPLPYAQKNLLTLNGAVVLIPN